MAERITTLWPEIALFITMTVVVMMGLSPNQNIRRMTIWVTPLGLLIALGLSFTALTLDSLLLPSLASFVKPAVCLVGLILGLGIGSIDRDMEQQFGRGRLFDPLLTTQGEFYAFFLLSLIGVMLCTTANDLIWLFLALELTSLPTYVMVAAGRSTGRIGHEAAVKYFFLGALSAAIFLYGFALIYGSTGSMHFAEIRAAFIEQYQATGSINIFGRVGIIMAVVGIMFKIAAVPMHFYTADVYEGASTPVSAFLAFVPKTAGFVCIILLTTLVAGTGADGQTFPPVVHDLLWLIAVATMTVGNTLALLQTKVKRILAYSSIAHSGYMLIGIIAGPVMSQYGSLTSNGYGAVLFYLVAYGVMNIGAFLVLCCVRDGDRELETLDDLAGLHKKHPGLSIIMAICALSLLGLPPLIGFFGKLYLFSAGISAGEYALVVIAGLNSAVSAWYYLKLAGLPWLGKPSAMTDRFKLISSPGKPMAAGLSALGVIVLIFIASPIMSASHRASLPLEVESETVAVDESDEVLGLVSEPSERRR